MWYDYHAACNIMDGGVCATGQATGRRIIKQLKQMDPSISLKVQYNGDSIQISRRMKPDD